MNSEHELAKRNFRRLFPGGFLDDSYLERERDYKVRAHRAWHDVLEENQFRELLRSQQFEEIGSALKTVYRRLNLLGTFEFMALNDALKTDAGAQIFSLAIHDYVYGTKPQEVRFDALARAIGSIPLPRGKLTTWPIQTVFPFLANPKEELFLKPVATKTAAQRFGFELNYRSGPNYLTYSQFLRFGRALMDDLRSWKPRDFIDIQSFIWVTTSEGYAEELV